MYRTDFWTLSEKARVGWFKRIASKHVYYLGWKRSPAQVGCMRQALGPGALGRPRGIGRKGRWEGGSGWGIHVKPWLILVNVWQKWLQYCKVISLQLTKKNTRNTYLFNTYIYTYTYIKYMQYVQNISNVYMRTTMCWIVLRNPMECRDLIKSLFTKKKEKQLRNSLEFF